MPEKIHLYLGKEFAQNNINKAKCVILPIGYEKTPSYGKGARYGPAAILKASRALEEYDIELEQATYKIGIYTHKSLDCSEDAKTTLNLISKTIAKLVESNKFILSLGGEHSITPAILKGYLKHYDNFTVLCLDAHGDLRNKYLNSLYNHACTLRRIWELKNCNPVIIAGVRGICEEENLFYRKNKDSIFIYPASKIHRNTNWTKEIVGRCKKNVYLSIDADVFDPAFVSSVGTPEPGGLSWNQTMDLLIALKKAGKKIIGADLVELAPIKGLNYPDFLCAKLIYKIIGYRFFYNRTKS